VPTLRLGDNVPSSGGPGALAAYLHQLIAKVLMLPIGELAARVRMIGMDEAGQIESFGLETSRGMS
jgi:hypothetical protein